MITKEGKARWVYRCSLCGVMEHAPDQLRILEAEHRHVRGNLTHLAGAITAAFRPFAEALNRLVGPVTEVSEQLERLQMPAPNTPHDPALRADKRKWGGR